MRNRWLRSPLVTFFVGAFVVFSAQRPKPFNEDEVKLLLKQHGWEFLIETQVRNRGIDFDLTTNVEKDLRSVGASDHFIQTIRELSQALLGPVAPGSGEDGPPKVVGYVTPNGEFRIEPRFQRAAPFSEGLAIADNTIIDRDGKTVASRLPKIDSDAEYEDGVVQFGEFGKRGFLDRQGNVVIKPLFLDVEPFREGVSQAWVRRGEETFYGYINKSGGWVIQPRFPVPNHGHVLRSYPFSDGLAQFRRGSEEFTDVMYGGEREAVYGRVGYINHSGEVLIEPQFEFGGSFSGGVAPVQLRGKWGLIDKRGRFIVPAIFRKMNGISDGLAAFQDDKEHWGYLDTSGKIVIEARDRWSGSFSEGLALFYRDEAYGYIDKHGDEVIKPSFRWASDFRHGFALVRVQKVESDPGQACDWSAVSTISTDACDWNWIDRKGNFVLKPRKWGWKVAESLSIAAYAQ